MSSCLVENDIVFSVSELSDVLCSLDNLSIKLHKTKKLILKYDTCIIACYYVSKICYKKL